MQRILVAGATGYVGRHVVRELVARGHEVVCLARPGARRNDPMLSGAEVRVCEVTDRSSVLRDGARGERFDAVFSCLASRSGAPRDAALVDREANLSLLEACRACSASHFVLLSAICVQKPLLAFQREKLAFEETLVRSGLTYSVVRPTAFFKSLSGQVEAVKRGKPFLVFGDGALTACKPISEPDLARFMADCLEDPAKHDAILPVGGPGPAITPRAQGVMLAELVRREPKLRRVPVSLLDAIIVVLAALGRFSPRVAEKAELARIGRYYATESMLVFDPVRGVYDADATPSYGTETLRDFYARVLVEGLKGQDLGEQAVFSTRER